MRIKEMIGKTLILENLPLDQVTYLPEDYDYPCYRVEVRWDGFWPTEPGFFYADILVNNAMQIQKVGRYKNNFKDSKSIKVFPGELEGAFDILMDCAIK